jgi:hypothetical protein
MPKKKAPELPPEVLEYFREQGRIGGEKGGAAAAEKMTPEQKHERAKKGATARWQKAKRKGKK